MRRKKTKSEYRIGMILHAITKADGGLQQNNDNSASYKKLDQKHRFVHVFYNHLRDKCDQERIKNFQQAGCDQQNKQVSILLYHCLSFVLMIQKYPPNSSHFFQYDKTFLK